MDKMDKITLLPEGFIARSAFISRAAAALIAGSFLLSGCHDNKEPVRLAFISGMHPVFDTALYAPVLNGFDGVTWEAYTHEESQELFKQENKDRYDIIIFYAICLEELTETTKQDIVRVVGEGKPVFILHDGLLTYNTWPEFARIAAECTD